MLVISYVVQRLPIQKSGHEYHNIHYSDAFTSKTASPLPSPYSGSFTSLQSVGMRSPVVSRGSVSSTAPVIPER